MISAPAIGLRLGARRGPGAVVGVQPLPRPGAVLAMRAAEPPMEVDPGELIVAAQVEVAFALEG